MARVAKRALKLLAAERASEYGSWVNVLCSLKWIEERTEDESLLKAWHKFSRRCRDKYDEQDAQHRWDLVRGSAGGPAVDDRLAPPLGERGLRDAVAEIVDPTNPKPKKTRNEGGLTMATSDLSAIEVEAVKWLWKGRIPEAKLTIVAGDMGDGNSL